MGMKATAKASRCFVMVKMRAISRHPVPVHRMRVADGINGALFTIILSAQSFCIRKKIAPPGRVSSTVKAEIFGVLLFSVISVQNHHTYIKTRPKLKKLEKSINTYTMH